MTNKSRNTVSTYNNGDAMPHVPKEHIALFAETAALHGEVRLGVDVISEVFRRASQYEDLLRVLQQIRCGSYSNVVCTAWANGAVEQDDQTRESLTRPHGNPHNIVTITTLRKAQTQQDKSPDDRRIVLAPRRPPAHRRPGGTPSKRSTLRP
jgi:hypothetical protein